MSLPLVTAILAIADFLWPLLVAALVLGLAVTGDWRRLSWWPRWAFVGAITASVISMLMVILIWIAGH